MAVAEMQKNVKAFGTNPALDLVMTKANEAEAKGDWRGVMEVTIAGPKEASDKKEWGYARTFAKMRVSASDHLFEDAKRNKLAEGTNAPEGRNEAFEAGIAQARETGENGDWKHGKKLAIAAFDAAAAAGSVRHAREANELAGFARSKIEEERGQKRKPETGR